MWGKGRARAHEQARGAPSRIAKGCKEVNLRETPLLSRGQIINYDTSKLSRCATYFVLSLER